MSALKCRLTAIIALTGVDLSAATGKLISFDGAGTHAVTASATVPAVGVCVEGNVAAKDSAVAILGATEGSVRMVAGGAIFKGDRVMQKNDGTVVVDAGPGTARVVVGVALEAAAAGDLFEVAPIAPMILP
jgi:hypothetical protein